MNICNLRRKHDWNQEELAEKADVDDSTVQRWECGSVVPCGFDVYTLSVAFGVSTDAIYEGLPKSARRPLAKLGCRNARTAHRAEGGHRRHSRHHRRRRGFGD